MNNKPKSYISFIYIIIISFIIKLNLSYIVLPFKIISHSKIGNLTDIVNSLSNNKLIITLPMGSPKTYMDFYSSMNEYIYYLEEDSCLYDSKSSYNYFNSKTFSITKNLSFCSLNRMVLNKCSVGKDKLYLYQSLDLQKTIEVSDFIFYFGNRNKNENNYKNICGVIGFELENKPFHFYEYVNFLNMLKKKTIINSYSWYIHYYEKTYKINENEYYNGSIIIDIYDKSFYDDFPYFKNDSYYTVNAKGTESYLSWIFSFENIYYIINNKNYTKNNIYVKEAGIAFENDLIISPEQYFYSIKVEFFNNFLKNKTCFLINEKYIYIYCNKSFKTNTTNFPPLHFKSNGMNKEFILNEDDLFKEYSGYILFMIVCKKNYNKYWILGKIFLKKYNFYFDNDKKIIGLFYKNNIIKKENKNNVLNFFGKIKWYIFIFIGIILGILIGRKIREKNRKLRANELEDSFEYLTNKANNNNNDTISNYKAIKSQLYDIKQDNIN